MFNLAKTFLFGVAFAACFAGGYYYSQYSEQGALPESMAEAEALFEEKLTQADAVLDSLIKQADAQPTIAAHAPSTDDARPEPVSTPKTPTPPASHTPQPAPPAETVASAPGSASPDIQQAILNNLQALENLRSLD